MIPSRDLALEIGDERLTNMVVVLGAAVQNSGVVSLKSLKKALYPALDPRYHKMIDMNILAMEKGAQFVKDGKYQSHVNDLKVYQYRISIMEEKKDKETGHAYEDFLADVSNQFARRDEEREFMDSIDRESPQEDLEVNVGERVREVRESQGLSLQDISQRTDIDVSMLEEIEDGAVAPPLGIVIKLAKALEMKMGYFISGKEDRSYTIVRGDDRKIVSRYDSKKGEYYGYEYESLAPHKKNRHMEPFLVTLEPADTEEERSTHDGQEFIYVLEGTMEVRLGEDIHILEPGDSIYYDSIVPHLVKCHGSKVTRILAVLYAER